MSDRCPLGYLFWKWQRSHDFLIWQLRGRGGMVVNTSLGIQMLGVRAPLGSPARHIYPPKVLVIPRKQWLHPNMTEKLFTGTLSIKPKKKKKLYDNYKPLLMRTYNKGFYGELTKKYIFEFSTVIKYVQNVPYSVLSSSYRKYHRSDL